LFVIHHKEPELQIRILFIINQLLNFDITQAGCLSYSICDFTRFVS